MTVLHLLALVAALVCFLLAAFGAGRIGWGWLGAAILTADALVVALGGMR